MLSITIKPIPAIILELDESSRPYRDNQYASRSLPIIILAYHLESPLHQPFFQRLMEKILQGVVCYIDNILVTGKSEDNHMKNLLLRLEKHGFRLKKEKCSTLSGVLGAPH